MITVRELAREVVRVGRAEPDHTYVVVRDDEVDPEVPSGCRYWDRDTNQACLIGRALFNLELARPEDFEAGWLRSYNGASARTVIEQLAEEGLIRYDDSLVDESVMVQDICVAQSLQDNRNTWGSCVTELNELLHGPTIEEEDVWQHN